MAHKAPDGGQGLAPKAHDDLNSGIDVWIALGKEDMDEVLAVRQHLQDIRGGPGQEAICLLVWAWR